MVGTFLGKIIVKRILTRVALGAVLFFTLLTAALLIQVENNPSLEVNAKDVMIDMPLYNWHVCEDLWLGDVPGVPDQRVRLRLCSNQGWEILAYCLQPHLEAPPIDTTCENTGDDTYWCGDEYQLLRAYDILVTPTPTATNTNTPTATNTNTPTATNTNMPTATATATATSTPTPTNTPTATNTQEGPPPVSTATAPPRTGPGGKGNLEWISLAFLAGGSLLAISIRVFAPKAGTLAAKQMPAEIEFPVAQPLPAKTVPPRPVHKGWLLGVFLLLVSALFGYWIARAIFVPPPLRPAASDPHPAAALLTLPPTGTQAASPPSDELMPTSQILAQPAQPFEYPQSMPLLDDLLDFSSRGGKIEILIDPPGPLVNRGKPIKISFKPGDTCVFGDHQACVTTFEVTGSQYNHYFLSIHSGVGGEGQAFRHALEGTGINRAGYGLEKVAQHIKALRGAQVTIAQEGDELGGFFLAGLIRIPPAYLEAFLKQPVTQAVQFATNLDPSWADMIDPERPMLIFETCGWKMPSEPWYPGVTSTTGSIYLAVIQPLP